MGNSFIIREGDLLNRYMKNKFNSNKNILAAITGPTGSGKTYIALRQCELWYEYYFNEEFPIKNVCFSVGELIKRLSSGEMREGDLLILEEAGVNIGSSDWQNKVVKMFNYVLQSFRNMNVGVIMTLPVLTMLAKQARQLLHLHLITQSIDYVTNISKSKCLFHQLNQMSGKSYWKFLRVNYRGKIVAVERLCYGLPSEKLRSEYETKKIKFVSDLTTSFSAELDKIEREKAKKDARDDMTKSQLEVYKLLQQYNGNIKQVAKIRGCYPSNIYSYIEKFEKKGFSIDFKAKSLGKSV